MIRVYTDGSYRKLLNSAGAGVVIIWEDGTMSCYHKYLGDTTNNCAELHAIKHALCRVLIEAGGAVPVTVYSDSTYALGIAGETMKAKANKELAHETRIIASEFTHLKFKWVKGHSRDKYNKIADLLANVAIDQELGLEENYNQDSQPV